MPLIRRISWKRSLLILSGGICLTWLFGPSLADLWPRTFSAETIAEGRTLFTHEWQVHDELSGGGDGLGPVFNARSCVACHFQGGVGGAAPNKNNVLSFEVLPTPANKNPQSGVVHAQAIATPFQETPRSVAQVFPVVPNGIRVRAGCDTTFRELDPVRFANINTPLLFGVGRLNRISNRAIARNSRRQQMTAVGREFHGDFSHPTGGRPRVLADGRIGKFGWKSQFATAEEFVATACAIELGLTNSHRAQIEPQKFAEASTSQLDMTDEQLTALTAFVLSLPTPIREVPTSEEKRARVATGEHLFGKVGCADCHTPNLGGADGIYSDLLLHQVEDEDGGGSSYVQIDPVIALPKDHPRQSEWKTPPLWGVADTAPYFHDGGALTLESAILRHGAEAKHSTAAFRNLTVEDRESLLAFLKTLRTSAHPESLVARD